MDQSAGQSQPPRPQNEGHRDMMFCHECHDEWYRDEHGLACPECGSDFTEIIEENSDPRDTHMHDHEPDEDHYPDHEDMHDFPGHDPHGDPAEGDISNVQFRQLGPGSFQFTGAVLRTYPGGPVPGAGSGNGNSPLVGPFASMLTNLLGGGPRDPPGPQQQQQGSQGQQGGQASERQGTPTVGPRFTYSSSAQLFPRDSNNPGPHVEPVDELNNVLVGLLAAFGQPPDTPHHDHDHDHDHDHNHFHGNAQNPGNEANGPQVVAMRPLMSLLSSMWGGPVPIGDAVYSQEALDRIVTQLMEQNASSNAPGPAAQSDVEALPRKPVTIEMLGPEGHAECSICMEEVKVGEEVAELPCKHWFHHPCVAAWLGEHNTCPHCRKGISKPAENAGNDATAGQGQSSTSGAELHVPGSFNVTTTSSTEAQDGSHPSNTAEEGQPGGGSGLGERLRRGLFGPQR